jgi:hypothetical protein
MSRLLRRNRTCSDSAFVADSTLWQLQAKRRNRKFSGEIEGRGGKVVRVKLDYEIKRDLYADLAQTWQDQGKCPETVKEAVARRHGLKVVNKEIQIPDMRLEYANDPPSKPLRAKTPVAACSSTLRAGSRAGGTLA